MINCCAQSAYKTTKHFSDQFREYVSVETYIIGSTSTKIVEHVHPIQGMHIEKLDYLGGTKKAIISPSHI